MRKYEIESIQLQDINESLIEQHELDVPAWSEPLEATQEERDELYNEYLQTLQKFNDKLQSLFDMYIKAFENDRVEAIKSRWAQLTDQIHILHSQGDLRPNHYDKLAEIIESDDIEFLDSFEIVHSERLAKIAKQKALDLMAANGESHDAVCKKVLNYIRGYNVANNLSLVQINELMTNFATINGYLNAGMPKTAKELINAVEVGGVVTVELKSDLLEILKEF